MGSVSLRAILVVLICLWTTASSGWPVRGQGASPTGLVQVNGFDVGGQSFAFINFLKNSTGITSSGGYAYPAILDINGYPTSTPATSISISPVAIPTPTIYSGAYVIKNANVSSSNVAGTPSGTFKLTLVANAGGTFTVVSDYNGSASGSGTSTLTVSGTNPRVTFTLSGTTPSSNGVSLTMTWPTTGTWSGTPNLVLCRADQEDLLDAGQPFEFNPDFISLLQQLNPSAIRTMDWSAMIGTISSQYSYRAPLKAFSYRVTRWVPEAWAGNLTNGGSGIAFTASAPSGWGGLVEGATFQAKIIEAPPSTIAVSGSANNGSGLIRLTVADTTSLSNGQRVAYASGSTANGVGVWTLANVVSGTPGTVDLVGSQYQSSTTGSISVGTFNIGGSGAKIAARSSGTPSWSAGDLVTATYDSVVDAWFVTPRGIGDVDSNGAVPYEVQVALANKVRTNLWVNYPFYYTDASLSAAINYIRDNLNSNLTAFHEYSNEVFNNAFTQAGYAYQRGQKMGFPVNHGDGLGNGQNASYYGLRSRQIFGIVESLYGAAGKTNYQRVIGGWLYGSTQLIKKYTFDGYDLAPSGTSTGSGNSVYNSFTGSANYTSFPARPVDHADTAVTAPYTNGAQISSPLNGQSWAACVTTGGPSGWTTGLIGAADAYAAGGSTNIANAFAFVDWDITQGTCNGSARDPNLTLNGAAAKFSAWETIFASYDSVRTGAGMPLLKGDSYEGAISFQINPGTSDCTTMGVDATTYCGTSALPNSRIYNLLLAYKQSDNFKNLVTKSYNDFRAYSHSRYPSWYHVQGTTPTTDTSVWSLFQGGTYPPTTFKSWDATVNYNNP